MSDLDLREWLEADGLGGFASGTVSGVRTRRYHALLLAATHAADGPHGAGERPRGVGARRRPVWSRSRRSATRPASCTRTARAGSTRSRPSRGRPGASRCRTASRSSRRSWCATARRSRWWAGGCAHRPSGIRLCVRPLLSGRDYHALHHENPGFGFAARARDGERLRFAPYPGVPERRASRRTARYDARAGLVPPLPLRRGARARPRRASRTSPRPACSASTSAAGRAGAPARRASGTLDGDDRRAASARTRCAPTSASAASELREPARSAPPTPTSCSAARAGRSSPAIRGSPTGAATRSSRCAGSASRPAGSTTRGAILLEWAGAVSEGMLPNRFPDAGETPEFNAVDASLWYVVAVGEYLRRAAGGRARRARAACAAPSTRSSTATPRAPASASAPTRTACSPPACPACSSPGWTRGSATGS